MDFRCDGQIVDFYYDEDDNWEGLHSSMFRMCFDYTTMTVSFAHTMMNYIVVGCQNVNGKKVIIPGGQRLY